MSGVIDSIYKNAKKAIGCGKLGEEFVMALADCDAEDAKSGISFQKGDQFLLESDKSGDWWQVRRVDNGKQGFARPAFLVRGSDMFFNDQWISTQISCKEAETELLSDKFAPGAFVFLPRANNSISVSLSLIVKVQKLAYPEPASVAHFELHREGTAFRVAGGSRCFATLTELVEHHADRRNTSNIRLSFSLKKNQFVAQWEYRAQEIMQGKYLSRGAFGEVFKGTLHGVEAVAVKKLKKMFAEDFLKEAEIARPCKHPNIVETIGICSDMQLIITEFLENGSLKDYMTRNVLSLGDCKSVAEEVACGMRYLASKKIVHRDLAARNILVGTDLGTIKIADFGQARGIADNLYYYTVNELFSRRWTATEAFVIYEGESLIATTRGKVTGAVDVWSYGVVLWELHTNGQIPYREIADHDIYTQLTENNYRLTPPDNCPKAISDLMNDCWNKDRKLRPTFKAICEVLASLSFESEPPGCNQSQTETSTVPALVD